MALRRREPITCLPVVDEDTGLCWDVFAKTSITPDLSLARVLTFFASNRLLPTYGAPVRCDAIFDSMLCMSSDW